MACAPGGQGQEIQAGRAACIKAHECEMVCGLPCGSCPGCVRMAVGRGTHRGMGQDPGHWRLSFRSQKEGSKMIISGIT